MSKMNALMKLASLVEDDGPAPAVATETKLAITGQHIVVLDRGFVYVGEVRREADFLIISNARNIRKWGTSKGLGELINGSLPDTVLDPVGEVKTPLRAVIHLIPCKGF